MNRQLLIITALSITALNQLNGQVPGNYQYNNQQTLQSVGRNPASNAVISVNNEVTIEVNGLMNIVADNFVAVFNIVQVGESIDSTNQIMNRRILNFQNALKGIGVDASDIKIDMLSFVPKYDLQVENRIFSKSYNEIPAGYELQKNVSVRYNAAAKLDEIVSAAASSEIYDLVKVDYFIANTQKSIDSLRVRCLQEIKSKTKSYDLIGFKLDTLKKVMSDNFVTIYPPTRYFSYQAFSRPSLNAARKKSSPPNVTEIAKTTSKFYAPVDYDQYDIVINPVITEPVVQISYTVVVKYFLKPEEKQINNYYILTPSGDIKQFNPK
ncbi:MAG: SIMPL domain-containing protein [Bacteroidia bacterium]